MKVNDVMTSFVHSCGPDTSLGEAAMTMQRNDCGILPVTNTKGRVLGMITDRDICMAVATKAWLASEITAKEVMSGEVYACTPDDDVRMVLRIMQEKRVRRLPVVIGDQTLHGIVSINDMVLRALEEKRSDLPLEEVMKTMAGICDTFAGLC